RELALRVGDKIARQDLDEVLEQENNKIFNTDLFTSTHIHPYESEPNKLSLIISVDEQWYLWPTPILELADRNFNEWKQRGMPLDRIEYGGKLIQNNFRGRNERLLLHLQFGFTRKIILDYRIPYISRKQRTGLRFNLLFAENNSVAYQTNDHFLDFVDGDPNILRRRFEAAVTLSKRFNFYASHSFTASFGANQIKDTIAQLNPDYFLDGRLNQRYFGLGYRFRYDRRDRAPYPLRGYQVNFSIMQEGLGVFGDLNLFTLRAYGAKYTEIGKRFFVAHGLGIKVALPDEQPYFNRRALGYNEEFVRGFDLKVIDGQRHIFGRNEAKLKVFDVVKHFDKVPLLKKVRHFRKIPMALYFKIFTDGGYVYDTDTRDVPRPLSNTFLHSIGVGVDFVTYYNLALRFEYSLTNQSDYRFDRKPGETGGFFLNLRAGI
ncbi:MAG: BamA/TamA family outer membrane protein, partial [Bacteroidota bacterium]